MTWVVGTPSMWGYGTAISDIRVTFPDGSSLDCLQKVYAVGPFIAAAFAGSVEFGFGAVQDLTLRLRGRPSDEAWIPGWVAFKWYRRARRRFADSPESVRRLGAEIMLVGASPTADLGIPGFARPTVAVLRAPRFEPEILRLNAIGSIGSGAGVEPFRDELARLNANRKIQLDEAGSPGGFAHTLMHRIRRTVEEHPDRFASPHVHVCIVRRGEITLNRSDYTAVEAGRRREFRMPPVARSWSEFVALCEQRGANATAATS